jgi:uncharacterized SAM-binding protein YcdF (DUF218 family)
MPETVSTAVEGASCARSAGWARRMRGLVVFMLVLTGLGAAAWLAREPLLRSLADLWIVSDDVTQADAVAVLGGQIEVRPFAAADLYHRGLVKKVLVSSNREGRAAAIGGAQGHMEANRRVLLKLGVPESAIETFGQANRSTGDEAAALREWTERHGVSSIIIPTEVFAARRVRWVFGRELVGRGIRVQVLSLEPPEYTRTEWWRTTAGLIAFQNEVVKYIYYRLQY